MAEWQSEEDSGLSAIIVGLAEWCAVSHGRCRAAASFGKAAEG